VSHYLEWAFFFVAGGCVGFTFGAWFGFVCSKAAKRLADWIAP
jgi:hypothetical protein